MVAPKLWGAAETIALIGILVSTSYGYCRAACGTAASNGTTLTAVGSCLATANNSAGPDDSWSGAGCGSAG